MSSADITPGSGSPRSIGIARPKGIPVGPLMAIALVAGLAAWMSSAPAAESPALGETPVPSENVQSVRVIFSHAEIFTQDIAAKGETQPFRKGQITARRSAIVSAIPVVKGQDVQMDEPIVILTSPGFGARSTEAAAQLSEAQRNLQNTQKLRERGLTTEDALIGARTQLASAEAGWASIEAEREDLTIRAPFAGRINALDVELGQNLSAGASVGEVLDMTKLLVKVSIPQGDVSAISKGTETKVHLVTGETVTGEVHYISASADAATRSFPVEIIVENPEHRMRSGVSADITIPGPEIQAHSIPTAYLSLDDTGQLVVKTAQNDRVVTSQVDIVGSDKTSVKVAGLPEEATIITLGQGFVTAGDKVRVEITQ